MDVPTRIEVTEGGADVVLTWDDGTVQVLSAAQLRQACPCAGCREPAGVAQVEALVAGPVPIEIGGAELVGAYAINFVFRPDGHHAGIYSFEWLRSVGSAGTAG